VFVPEILLRNFETWRKIASKSEVVVYESREDSATFQCFDGKICYTAKLYYWNFPLYDKEGRREENIKSFRKYVEKIAEELKAVEGLFTSCVLVAEEY